MDQKSYRQALAECHALLKIAHRLVAENRALREERERILAQSRELLSHSRLIRVT